eukprot:4588687-Amphidinium_carterae.2
MAMSAIVSTSLIPTGNSVKRDAGHLDALNDMDYEFSNINRQSAWTSAHMFHYEHVFDNQIFKQRALDLGNGVYKSPPYAPQNTSKQLYRREIGRDVEDKHRKTLHWAYRIGKVSIVLGGAWQAKHLGDQEQQQQQTWHLGMKTLQSQLGGEVGDLIGTPNASSGVQSVCHRSLFGAFKAVADDMASHWESQGSAVECVDDCDNDDAPLSSLCHPSSNTSLRDSTHKLQTHGGRMC